MIDLTATEARANLYRLIDETAQNHEPVHIAGPRNNAVLLSAEDWNVIQETLHLLSVRGMRESIREELKTPISKMAKALNS
jgi:antitoxin YefM